MWKIFGRPRGKLMTTHLEDAKTDGQKDRAIKRWKARKDSNGQLAFDQVWARKSNAPGAGGAPLGTYRG